VVERRSSEVLSTLLTDDGPVYHALSVHLSRAKLITRFNDRYAVAKFLSPEFGEKFQREVPLFLKIPEFPYCGTGRLERNSPAQNQPNSFNRFDSTPTCDIHKTHGHSCTGAGIASRG